MSRRILLGVLACSLFLASGCRSGGRYAIGYAPSPIEVPVTANSVPGSQARALVSILGVARAEDGRPDRVEARLRIENLGSVEAGVPADGFSLVAADLVPFGPPNVAPGPVTIPPGDAGTVDAWFALPAGRGVDNVDWSGLNLRFAVEFAGARVTSGATFTRSVYPYWRDEPRWRVGIGIGHHW